MPLKVKRLRQSYSWILKGQWAQDYHLKIFHFKMLTKAQTTKLIVRERSGKNSKNYMISENRTLKIIPIILQNNWNSISSSVPSVQYNYFCSTRYWVNSLLLWIPFGSYLRNITLEACTNESVTWSVRSSNLVRFFPWGSKTVLHC